MPDAVTDSGSKQANEKLPKKGVGKYKWYLIGGLGLVAVLVFFFVSKSNANANTTTGTTSTSLDPATQAALANALQSQAGAYNSGSITGPQGPAGPAGPAGPKGPQGPKGPKGGGSTGKPPTKKPKNPHEPEDPGSDIAKGGPGNPTLSPLTPMSGYYTAKPGDTLHSIAAMTNVPPHAIWTQNKYHLGNNPIIVPGQRLRIR